MIGLVVNIMTASICVIWIIVEPKFESLVALLCALSTLAGQFVDRTRAKKETVNQKIKAGNKSKNIQIGKVGTR